jgi:hypothetical protein
MDVLRRLFGGGGRREPGSVPTGEERVRQEPRTSADERGLERYRYLLRTAPPETIEEAHAEAFAQLTPEQRRMVLEELSRELPEHERTGGVRYEDDPRSLARLATRTEMRQPGALERSFGGMGSRGIGYGGLMAGSFLSAFAGILVGSAIAEQFFGDTGYDQGSPEGDDTAQADADVDADDGGDSGGDLGGGDFGGGDFGGGDFGGGS